MKFSIPYPSDGLDFHILDIHDEVSEIYLRGPSKIFGTARPSSRSIPKHRFKKICKEAHDRGCHVNVVLNATCLGGRQFTRKWRNLALDYFTILSDAGVDGLIVSDPYLISMAKEFSFQIIVSVLAFVSDPVRARYFDEMEVDRITLPPDINRSPNIIKEIKKATKCELGIIVNEGCLFNCPCRIFCYNFISHVSTNISQLGKWDTYLEKIFPPYYNYVYEIAVVHSRPYLLLTSPWIRPENLIDYEKLGIKYVKISGREKPMTFLRRCLDAYCSYHFEGNIFEIIDNVPRINIEGMEIPIVQMDNRNLDDFCRKVMECSKNCTVCNFCEEYAKTYMNILALPRLTKINYSSPKNLNT